MKLDDVITYWSQITLVLFIIGYFIQRIYELRLKNKETRHSLFQQNKINSIMKFLSCYTKAEQFWKGIPYISIIKKKYSTNELDEMIWPILDDLQSSKNELAMFLDEESMIIFEEITDSILQINGTLLKFYFNENDERNIFMINEFSELCKNNFKENKNRIFKIGKMTRKMFNS